jgi:L-arabinokinase
MRILYYITSHGYGHAVRSAAVCCSLRELLGEDLRLTVCSDVPERFFAEELPFPHGYRRGGFDVGCLQGDGVTVLVEETLRAYSDIAINNKSRLDGEAKWCGDNGVDCIVSDITPFAFDVADKAGVPSVAVGNFTWYDIYLPYVERFPEYRPMLLEMAGQYRKASVALSLYPASPMPVFDNKKSMPTIGRRGVDKRGEIDRRFGIDGGKRLGLIYVGNFGLGGINWKRLEEFGGWEFVGVYPLLGGGGEAGPRNFHKARKELFRYQDLSASADAIIGKMGYGVFSESLINGVPLIYLPRGDFSEFAVLDAEAKRIGSGVCVEAGAFGALGWGGVLDGAVDNSGMIPADGGGAGVCAEEIVKAMLSAATLNDGQ